MFLSLWLISCWSPSPITTALSPESSLDDALEACKTLSSGRHAPCALDVLFLHGAIQGDQCEKIPPGTWRGECYFFAAESPEQSISSAHALCDKAEGFERDCHFHLWQAPLIALKPGSSTPSVELSAAQKIHTDHLPYMSSDPGYTKDYWTWFWGTWWTHQDKPWQDTCSTKFTTPQQQAQCETWSQRGQQWATKRRPSPL